MQSLLARLRVEAARRFREARAEMLDQDPSFWSVMAPLLAVAAILFTRDPRTNFIFDEQEALLANPYVNGTSLPLRDVVFRDFWGLPPTRSIGSYRPLPSLVWRLVAMASRGAHNVYTFVESHAVSIAARALASIGLHGAAREVAATPPPGAFGLQPWLFHWVNVVLHAAVGSLLVLWVFEVTRRRGVAWLAGFLFVGCAVLTEAVSGVVGLADVLGGMGVVLVVRATLDPSITRMAAGVLGGALVALFAKESGLVAVPIAGAAGLLLAPSANARRPRPLSRAVVATLAAVAAFAAYVDLRKRWFPTALPAELTTPLAPGASVLSRAARSFLVWYHQPALPHDPLNNPLVKADFPHRLGGGLRVFFRGALQVVWPRPLSGDYSFPQEPIPEKVWFPESVLGLLLLVGPPLLAMVIALRAARDWRARSRLAPDAPPPVTALLVALCLFWIPVSYFPVSNIPVVLPTVRAERFWYFPALATSVLLAIAFAELHARTRRLARGAIAPTVFTLFFGVQCAAARLHAFDYKDDLTFWDATRAAVPRSAKAHLNYSVMQGARGEYAIREASNRVALALAPEWPMANVYLGDVLCREHRAEEGWPHMVRGFQLAPDDPGLIALALQCLWDEGAAKNHMDELTALGNAHVGTWLDFLAKDLVYNGEDHGGVDPKYRPRGYNEGPKD